MTIVEWNIIRFLMGSEMDAFFERRVKRDGTMIMIEKKDLDDLYFKIRDRVERQFNIQVEDRAKEI